MRRLTTIVLVAAMAGSGSAWAQRSPVPDPELAASQAITSKLNAYVALANQTLRASESLARYESWANMKTGPTGRESIVYGLYALYDVRGEIEKARAATAMPPALPALDAEIPAYIGAYEALAPLITKANGYYERQDYKVDRMAEGKMLHATLVPAAKAFLDERAKVDALLRIEKDKADAAELAFIEAREGRKVRWQVSNVMIRARQVVDRLPSEKRPVVDLAAFDGALGGFATGVKALDDYSAANPGLFSAFEGRPRAFLGKLREFREKLGTSKGDARGPAGRDLIWIVNDYNTMISTSQMATRFPR
jgi:hypothetical protein